MHTAVRFEIFVSVLLLSVLCTCVSEEQEESCPKIRSALNPVQMHGGRYTLEILLTTESHRRHKKLTMYRHV